jgi:hypothetical protein
VDRELVNQPRVEILLDRIGTSRYVDISISGNLSRSAKCALDAIIDEVERRAAGALPGLAHLIGQNKDGGMKRGLLGPEALAATEHPLSHDADAGALKGCFQHAVLMPYFAACAEVEILTEELLLRNPMHEFIPLFVVRVVSMGQVHPFWGNEAVQGYHDIEKYFACVHRLKSPLF